MEENHEEITSTPKLTKGQKSDITPGEDDWYTIEKGKANAEANSNLDILSFIIFPPYENHIFLFKVNLLA